jgi:hypothetical protein
VGVRSNRYFGGAAAYFAGATYDIYCTICPDKTMEGGWAHTLSCCLNPVIKGMRINRHNELVRVLRDTSSTPKKVTQRCMPIWWRPVRDDIIIPQVTDEEWDFEARDSGSEQTLHDTAPAKINPLALAVSCLLRDRAVASLAVTSLLDTHCRWLPRTTVLGYLITTATTRWSEEGTDSGCQGD